MKQLKFHRMKTNPLFLWLAIAAIAAIAAMAACTKPENQPDPDTELPEQPELLQAVDTVYEWRKTVLSCLLTAEQKSKVQTFLTKSTEKDVMDVFLRFTKVDTTHSLYVESYEKIGIAPEVVDADKDTVYEWRKAVLSCLLTADQKGKVQTFSTKNTEKEVLDIFLRFTKVDTAHSLYVESYKKIGIAPPQ